jgi:rubredoxin
MTDNLFKEGGPLNVRREGNDRYKMSISLPTDEDGLVGRECPNEVCSPGYFKVKPGTGITDGQINAFCPYCRTEAEPGDFITKAQTDYALTLVENEAVDGINRMLNEALDLGASGKKKMDAGLFSIEMSLKPATPNPISRPLEEELRRDVTCPHCGLEHSVFGLAIWCADCGEDIFLTHVDKELQVIEKMLSVVGERRQTLGARVAGRDVENALEDLVSVFEAVLKFIAKLWLDKQGMSAEEVVEVLEKKVRNQFQNIDLASSLFKKYLGVDLFENIPSDNVGALRTIFEKRHPITHNLGVIDRKYLDHVRNSELQGREIRVNNLEVLNAIEIAHSVISSAYQKIQK